MELRARRDEDLDELVAVASRVHALDNYPIFLPGGDFARFLTRPEPVAAWVAVRDGRPIGHVALNAETSPPVMRLVSEAVPAGGRALYVARLLVDPSARREGIGRRLLEHARRAALERGHVPMLDVVDTPTARAAISLYRREGWQEVGRVTFHEAIEELVFRGPDTPQPPSSEPHGPRLRSHRTERGWSLRETATQTGIPRLRIDLIERGAPPPPHQVEALIDGLGIDDDLAAALREVSLRWRRPQAEDWGAGMRVETINFETGVPRTKDWYYFVLDRKTGPCFLEPADRPRWVRDILANPRVRLIVNDGVYEGVAYVEKDAAAGEVVRRLFRDKYAAHDDPVVDELVSVGLPIVCTDDPVTCRRLLEVQQAP